MAWLCDNRVSSLLSTNYTPSQRIKPTSGDKAVTFLGHQDINLAAKGHSTSSADFPRQWIEVWPLSRQSLQGKVADYTYKKFATSWQLAKSWQHANGGRHEIWQQSCWPHRSARTQSLLTADDENRRCFTNGINCWVATARCLFDAVTFLWTLRARCAR